MIIQHVKIKILDNKCDWVDKIDIEKLLDNLSYFNRIE